MEPLNNMFWIEVPLYVKLFFLMKYSSFVYVCVCIAVISKQYTDTD